MHIMPERALLGDQSGGLKQEPAGVTGPVSEISPFDELVTPPCRASRPGPASSGIIWALVGGLALPPLAAKGWSAIPGSSSQPALNQSIALLEANSGFRWALSLKPADALGVPDLQNVHSIRVRRVILQGGTRTFAAESLRLVGVNNGELIVEAGQQPRGAWIAVWENQEGEVKVQRQRASGRDFALIPLGRGKGDSIMRFGLGINIPTSSNQAAGLSDAIERGYSVLPAPELDKPYNFKLIDVNGGEITGLQNRAAIIKGWATWCGPCQASLRELKEWYLGLPDSSKDKVDLIVVIHDPPHGQKREAALQKVAKLMELPHGLRNPWKLAFSGGNLEEMEDWQEAQRDFTMSLTGGDYLALPYTLLVGPDGILRNSLYAPSEDMAQAMSALTLELIKGED
ncbi:MAG: hypothetical protein DCC75_00790 [Proteobacteria bacterium]|nr:MAG: hypothetical protein DCC75_00790 [Pseudomonadota bacterium]